MISEGGILTSLCGNLLLVTALIFRVPITLKSFSSTFPDTKKRYSKAASHWLCHWTSIGLLQRWLHIHELATLIYAIILPLNHKRSSQLTTLKGAHSYSPNYALSSTFPSNFMKHTLSSTYLDDLPASFLCHQSGSIEGEGQENTILCAYPESVVGNHHCGYLNRHVSRSLITAKDWTPKMEGRDRNITARTIYKRESQHLIACINSEW